ncbi:MAG: hypothetical protein LC768_05505 [Acidobacteria bacterium]|nr:hypothetical protein [Acidobacteriota bacterium]
MSHSLRSTGQARAVVADKREAILKAAVKVFARKGFFNSKVADVAGEAGMHLEKLGADRDLAIVFQVELRGSTKFMEEFSAAGFAEYLEIIHQTIEDGQKTGVFRRDLNATVCSKILFGALDEMVTNWILSKKPYPLAPMADEVLKVFFGGVLK